MNLGSTPISSKTQRITLSIEKKMGVYEVFYHKMRKRKRKGRNLRHRCFFNETLYGMRKTKSLEVIFPLPKKSHLFSPEQGIYSDKKEHRE